MFLARLIVCLAIMPSSSYAESISGTYVEGGVWRGADNVSLIQLVETKDGHLTGRFQHFALQPDGKLIELNASLTGVRDGEMVVVEIKPTQLLSGSITASGTWHDPVIELTGGANGFRIKLILKKSDEEIFNAQVAELTRQAREINQRHNREQITQQARKQTQEMNAFAIAANAKLGQFAPTEARYKMITDNMRRALTRMRSIYGDGQASVARSQISVGISQAAIEADQLHNGVETARDNFNAKVETLKEGYDTLAQSCQSLSTVTAAASSRDDIDAACRAMEDSATRFQHSVATTRSGFSHIEEVWRVERAQQEKIVKAAEASD